ncbi:MAG: Trk system potassium transporter TrkA [Methermicoccaceae archaeon]
MRIVILGAGNVAYNVARTLSQRHDVLVIERDSERCAYIEENLDVDVICGNGVNVEVLKRAVEMNAKMLIALTNIDEVNIVACITIKRLDENVLTIARVRNPDYVNAPVSSRKFVGLDIMISPEMLAANKILQIVSIPAAIDYEAIPHFDIEVIQFRMDDAPSSMIDTPLRELSIPRECIVAAIHRNEEIIIPKGEDVFSAKDRIIVIGKPESTREFAQMLGKPSELKSLVLVGGGISGLYIAELLEEMKVGVKLIEKDEERCKLLSEKLKSTLVIHANGADLNVLRGEGMESADAFVCITNNDEKNLLCSLIAKKMGVPKVVAKFSRAEYEEIFDMVGVDAAVGYYQVMVNEVVKHISREHTEAVLILERFSEEVIALTVDEKAKIIGKPVKNVKFPEGAIIAFVLRGEDVIIPGGDTVLNKGDRVVLFTLTQEIPKLEKLFHTSLPLK